MSLTADMGDFLGRQIAALNARITNIEQNITNIQQNITNIQVQCNCECCKEEEEGNVAISTPFADLLISECIEGCYIWYVDVSSIGGDFADANLVQIKRNDAGYQTGSTLWPLNKEKVSGNKIYAYIQTDIKYSDYYKPLTVEKFYCKLPAGYDNSGPYYNNDNDHQEWKGHLELEYKTDELEVWRFVFDE